MFAQDYGNNAETLKLCTTLQTNSFSSNLDADSALDRILDVVGLSKNFVLAPCSDINNAVAVSFKGVRYILYDPEFMSMLSRNTSNWTNLFILAHEVGHHVNGHSLDLVLYAGEIVDAPELKKKREQELEADEFAGFVLAKLGASLNQTTSSVSKLSNEDDTFSTHPKRDKRILSITKGFNKHKPEIKVVKSNQSYVANVKTVSGDWTSETESRAQWAVFFENDTERGPKWRKKSPIDKKKELELYPIKEKNIKANGISYDGESGIRLHIRFQKWDNDYAMPDNSFIYFKDDEKLLKRLETRKRYNGVFTNIWIRLPRNILPKASNYEWEDDNILNDKLGYYKGVVNTKFYYLIDDNIEGYLYGSFDNWGVLFRESDDLSSNDDDFSYEDFTYEIGGKEYNYEDAYKATQKYLDNEGLDWSFREFWEFGIKEKWAKVKKPEKITNSSFSVQTGYAPECGDQTIEVLKFLDGLKKGKTLYLKFNEENIYECKESRRVSGLITQKTFVFDLKGSSKALSF